MSLRTRIAAIIAVTIAVTIATLSTLGYVFVRAEINGTLDRSLRAARDDVVQQSSDGDNDADDAPGALPNLQLKRRPGESNFFVQLVAADGSVGLARDADGALPVTKEVTDLARTGGPDRIYETEINDVHIRVLASSYSPGTAVLIAAPALELDNTLGRLQVAAIATGLLGTLLGAAVGLSATGATIRPLRRLTKAAEDVARTRDLSTQLPVSGKDEVSRLTSTFNEMLRALQEAEDSQRRLVSDASHELRTPLTSLRVNVELLAGRGGELPAEERQAVLEDIIAQARDLGQLMTGILDLARGQEQPHIAVQVSADDAVTQALATSRRDWPHVEFREVLEPCRVLGDPGRFQTAVQNLLGNAAKYAGTYGPIDVQLAGGILKVRDRGPGITPEDRKHVFDRFYRAASTQDIPGSGLGLAIVRQVAAEMGITARVEARPGGGTDFILDLRPVRHSTSEDAGAAAPT